METILSLIHRIDETIRTAGMLSEEEDRAFREQIEQRISAVMREAEASDLHWAETWFRPAEAELLRGYLRRAVSSRTAMTAPVYNHLLIGTEPGLLKQAQDFTKRFAGLAARFFDENEAFFVCIMTERQLLACRQDNYLNTLPLDPKRCRILLVPDFRAEDPERLLEVLDDPKSGLGIGRYSVILCGEEAAAEKVREYAGKDFRLGRYVLGKTHHFGTFTEQDVHEHTCRQLDLSGFAVTNEFRDRLELYIRAVYPEAVFRGKQFVNDLLIRIADTRADRLCFGKTLTAADVPYSRKAELLEAEKERERTMADEAAAAVPEAEKEKTSGNVLDISNEEYARLARENDGFSGVSDGRAIKLDGRSVNVLLLAMSTFPRRSSDAPHELTRAVFYDKDFEEENRTYVGRGQLDPIPKKISRDLSERSPEQALDYVVLLCTNETKKAVSEIIIHEGDNIYRIKQVSPVSFFTAQIDPYLNPATPDHLIQVPVGDNLANAVEEAVAHIRRLADRSTASGNAPKVRLFIDIHGGLRKTQMITQSVVSLLETDANRIMTQMYTVVNDASPRKYIAQSDDAMRIQSFVSGITEVISYGRTASLHRYFDADPKASDPKSGIGRIMDALDTVVDGISWCDVNAFESGLNDLTDCFDEDWTKLRQDGPAEDGSAYLAIFRENIKSGFSGLVTRERSILDEVRWCLDKGFFQQALTLIEAKIPVLFREKNLFIDQYDCESQKSTFSKYDLVNSADEGQRELDIRILQSLFNACAYYIGCEKRIQYLFLRGRSGVTTLDQLRKHKDIIDAGEQHLITKLNQHNSDIRPRNLPDGLTLSSFTVSFSDSVPEQDLTLLLLLHNMLKDLRNDSVHVKKFKYDLPRIIRILRVYLELCDSLIEIVPEERKKPKIISVGGCCTAIVKDYYQQTKKYLLRLEDGNPGVLARQNVLKGKTVAPGDRITVRVESEGQYAKECVQIEPFSNTARLSEDTKKKRSEELEGTAVSVGPAAERLLCRFLRKSKTGKSIYVGFTQKDGNTAEGVINSQTLPEKLLSAFDSMKETESLYAYLPEKPEKDAQGYPVLIADDRAFREKI